MAFTKYGLILDGWDRGMSEGTEPPSSNDRDRMNGVDLIDNDNF